jgi:uncharacterized protein YdeI (YjbR/CyaY-like superfamily)
MSSQELHVTNIAEWRAWLKRNHDVEKEVWLVFYKKHTGKPNISYDDAVGEALCFGWIDSIIKRIDEDRFARKFTPRKINSKWSKLNKDRAERMIREGRMTKPGLVQINEAKKSGKWFAKVLPTKEIEVPQFMRQALAANQKALRNFGNLAKSYKRQYIGWVMSAKKEDTKRKRLAEVVEHLENNKKLGMK